MNIPATVDLWIMKEPAWLDPGIADSLQAMLDNTEKERLQRYSRTEQRMRYLITRALVRCALADTTGQQPAALRFRLAPLGKPQLVVNEAEEQIHFNLSHTRGIAVLAVCRQAQVGVDVEMLDRTVAIDALARRYFSGQEQAALAVPGEEAKRRRFFAFWTTREACLKALGLGLRVKLNSFAVDFAGKYPVVIRQGDGIPDTPLACRHWFLEDAYSLSIAICTDSDQPVQVNFRQWSPDSSVS